MTRRAASASSKSIRAISAPPKSKTLLGDPTKAKTKLGWEPKTSFAELVAEMMREDFALAQRDELVKKHGFKYFNRFDRTHALRRGCTLLRRGDRLHPLRVQPANPHTPQSALACR